jgi:hypothetical protein
LLEIYGGKKTFASNARCSDTYTFHRGLQRLKYLFCLLRKRVASVFCQVDAVVVMYYPVREGYRDLFGENSFLLFTRVPAHQVGRR